MMLGYLSHALGAEVNSHSKVFMGLSMVCHHGTTAILKYTLVVPAQPFDGIVYNLCRYVRHFTVINVKTDGDLLLPNDFVPHTRVIRIHLIPLILIFQTPGELAVLQLACNHRPIDGIQALD